MGDPKIRSPASTAESEPVMTTVDSEQQQLQAPPPAASKALPPSAGGLLIPNEIVLHKDPDDDSIGFKAVIEGLTCASSYMAFRQALRTSAFVLLPMFTIAIHPNTMMDLKFPAMLIASVMSTSTHRGSLGEQLGIHSCTMRGYAYMLIWSLFIEGANVVNHIGAWWGVISVSIFLGFLVAHGILRRFMIIYVFVYMMEIRMYDNFFRQLPLANGCWFCADLLIGTWIGVAALLFPYPVLVKKFVDTIMDKIFTGIGKMCMGMYMFIMSPNPHAAHVFFADRTPFAKIEGVLAVMPALLWFANFEPTEFGTRNPIRRLKLSLLRRILALMYAAFRAGQVVVKLRCEQADRVAMLHIREKMKKQTARADEKRNNKNKKAKKTGDDDDAHAVNLGATFSGVVNIDTEDDDDDDTNAEETAKKDANTTEIKEKIALLRANTIEHKKTMAGTLMKTITAVGKTDSKPDKLLQSVPFDTLREHTVGARRNARVEILYVLQQTAVLTQARRDAERERDREPYTEAEPSHLPCGDEDGDGPSASAGKAYERYSHTDDDARTILAMQDVIDEKEIFIFLHEQFFLQIISMIAVELLAFGDLMQNYKPTTSLGRRMLNAMIVEPWHDFWEELWFRLTLARRLDVRVVKDAIRMTSAVLVACAMNFEIFIIQGGLYFFGTTILLGLPVEEESLGISINRITGNTIGCAIGYLTFHNVHNMSEMIAMTVCFTFLLQLFKGHPVFGQTFFYASIITPAGVATSTMTLALLTRVLASVYAILGFMLVCMIVFPSNTVKILWGSRVKLVKAMSEVLDNVAAAARMPITHGTTPQSQDAANEDIPSDDLVACRSPEVDSKMAELSIGVDLVKRMLTACNKWTPIAAREPMIRGTQQFPGGPSGVITSTHQRMVGSLELVVFALQLLHRPRMEAPNDALIRVVSNSVADFLDDFAGAVRLLFQSFIDSLQCSRTWAYPVALTYTSHLRKLRTRLHSVIFDICAVLSEPVAQGAWQLSPEDFAHIWQEVQEQRTAAAGAGGAGAETVRVQTGDAAAPQGAPTSARGAGAEPQAADNYPTEAPQGPQPPQQLPNASMVGFNASFADRYLGARRDLAVGGGGGGDAEANMSASFHDGEPVRNVTFAFDGTMRPGHNRPYRHTAPLAEAHVQPLDSYPLTQNDPEDELAQSLRKENSHVYSSTAPSRRPSQLSDGGSRHSDDDKSDYVPLPPRKQGSVLARALEHYKTLEPGLARLQYKGPQFNYEEDYTDLPLDTDLVALIVLLLSCDALMSEIEGMQWAINFINDYQKQLHESSLAISIIDKISAKVVAHRKKIHERYHNPEEESSLVIPQDIFRSWHF